MKNNLKGHFEHDEFLNFFRGYKRLDDSTMDAMNLFTYVRDAGFGVSPVSTKDYFSIKCQNEEKRAYYNDHFLGRYSYNEKIYAGCIDFTDFLRQTAQMLLTYGKVFYVIDWEKRQYKDYTLELPSFRYLPVETVYQKGEGKILQKYSFLKRIKYKKIYSENSLDSTLFNIEEIFFLKYPFKEKSPTQECQKYLGDLNALFQDIRNRSEAMTFPEKISFPIERARYQNSTEELRRHKLLQEIIAGKFMVARDSLPVTKFYDVFRVVKKYKYMNNFRQYMLKEFNQQVLAQVKKINRIDSAIVIQEKNMMTNEEIDEWFRKFSSGEIDRERFVDEVIVKRRTY